MMQYMDSTDHYDVNVHIARKWTRNIIGGAVSKTGGRNGGRCLQMGSGGVFKTLLHETGWVVGFAFYLDGELGNGRMYELSHAGNVILSAVSIQSDQTVNVYAGNGVTLIGNTGGSSGPVFFFQPNAWYYVEIKTELSSDGPIVASVTLHINGQELISGSGSTGVSSSGLLLGTVTANTHTFLAAVAVNTQSLWRDFYIADTTNGGNVDDFAGDVQISCLFPDGDSAISGWVPDTGSTLWTQINEQFSDDDTHYIKDNTANDTAEFTWQDVSPFSGVIVAVHYGALARKDQEGTRSFKLMTHGTANGPLVYPGDSYLYHFFAMDQDPATGDAWTQADFDASIFGVKTVS